MPNIEQPKTEQIESAKPEFDKVAQQERDAASHMEGLSSDAGGGGSDGGDGGGSDIDLSKESIDREKTMAEVGVNPDKPENYASESPEANKSELNQQFTQAAEGKPVPPAAETDKGNGGEDEDAPSPEPPDLTL